VRISSISTNGAIAPASAIAVRSSCPDVERLHNARAASAFASALCPLESNAMSGSIPPPLTTSF
jgi:hypothetical protein